MATIHGLRFLVFHAGKGKLVIVRRVDVSIASGVVRADPHPRSRATARTPHTMPRYATPPQEVCTELPAQLATGYFKAASQRAIPSAARLIHIDPARGMSFTR